MEENDFTGEPLTGRVELTIDPVKRKITQVNAFGPDDPIPAREEEIDKAISLYSTQKIRELTEDIISTLKTIRDKLSMEYCKNHGVTTHEIVFKCLRCKEDKYERNNSKNA